MSVFTFFVTDGGTPQTGLTPTLSTYLKISDGLSAGVAPVPTEVGGGWYKFTDTPAEELAIVIDADAGIADGAERFIPMQLSQFEESQRIAAQLAGQHMLVDYTAWNPSGKPTAGSIYLFASAADALAARGSGSYVAATDTFPFLTDYDGNDRADAHTVTKT